MISSQELEKVSEIFHALSNVVRLRILLMVADTKRPLHIKAIARDLEMDYGAIYRHIESLRKANLIKIYEVGRSRVLYPMRMETVYQLFEKAKEIISTKQD